MSTEFARLDWQETWLAVARIFGQRSLCVNSQVGAVAVSADNRFSWPGYNGPPAGLERTTPCNNWCPRASGKGMGTNDYTACDAIHAEVNALLRADASLLVGGTMYVARVPCINCARVVANSGIKAVVCAYSERDEASRVKDVFDYLTSCSIFAIVVGSDSNPAASSVGLNPFDGMAEAIKKGRQQGVDTTIQMVEGFLKAVGIAHPPLPGSKEATK